MIQKMQELSLKAYPKLFKEMSTSMYNLPKDDFQLLNNFPLAFQPLACIYFVSFVSLIQGKIA